MVGAVVESVVIVVLLSLLSLSFLVVRRLRPLDVNRRFSFWGRPVPPVKNGCAQCPPFPQKVEHYSRTGRLTWLATSEKLHKSKREKTPLFAFGWSVCRPVVVFLLLRVFTCFMMMAKGGGTDTQRRCVDAKK